MLTVILAPVLGVWWLFNTATEDFWNAYNYEGMGRECSMKYVGKQPVNSFRLALSKKVGDQIKLSMSLLGIDCQERM